MLFTLRTMRQASFHELVGDLTRAGFPVAELVGAGRVACIPAAGRVIALSFPASAGNVLWVNPDLIHLGEPGFDALELRGGPGGDRLWFGRELDYFWSGKPKWDTFANYTVPSELDPGRYGVSYSDAALVMRSDVHLTATDGSDIAFGVERAIELIDEPPAAVGPAEFVGISTTHSVQVSQPGLGADLWHLLQLPAGTTFVVPVLADAELLAYTPTTGAWAQREGRVSWKTRGDEVAKVGISASAVTGRLGALVDLGGERARLFVRDIEVHRSGVYVDHPFGAKRNDQVVQLFSGFGFCELEHRGREFGGGGPAQVSESDRLWVFEGPRAAIDRIGAHLLEVEITDL